MSTARSHTRLAKKRRAKLIRARWAAARKRGLRQPWQTWIYDNDGQR